MPQRSQQHYAPKGQGQAYRRASGGQRSRKSKGASRQEALNTESPRQQRRHEETQLPGQGRTISLEERLALVPSLDLSELPDVVDEARLLRNVPLQTRVVRVCLQRILDHTSTGSAPRNEQVTTLRRLLFEKGDTLLIARTGFGKSLIFHAFSLLTRLITLQIIPLSRLGSEQLEDICRFEGARPCLITTQTKRETNDLLAQVKQGLFTHVLLGPEQATSKAFRRALTSTGLQHLIGLVAIDECHLINQWADFRPEFTMIGELRMMLPQDVLWFGCSATLSMDTEKQVLEQGGFRVVGPGIYQTSIIRTSIDRPDITICVVPIPKGELKKVKKLYFLLDQSTKDVTTVSEDVPTPAIYTTIATPEDIPKTIVFIDGRHAIADAAAYLQTLLMAKYPRYSTDPADGRFCVYNIIETYTAHVAEHDRDIRYREIQKLDSIIRIIFATTCLGMGINIVDVDRVCLWNFPIGVDLGDFWQRLGRGGRGAGHTSSGYIFLPYWAFDSEGVSKAGIQPDAIAIQSASRKKLKNRLPAKKVSAPRSRLHQVFTPGDESDNESIASQDSTQELSTQDESTREGATHEEQSDNGEQGKRYWTKADEKRRLGLADIWKEMINGTCHRRAFLTHLCEYKVTPPPNPTPKDRCCSRCNPGLLPELPAPLSEAAVPRAPGSTTRAGIALPMIQQWATEQGELQFPYKDRRFPVHYSMFIDRLSCWQLAYLYSKERNWEAVDTDTLTTNAPAILNWEFRDSHLQILLERLRQLAPLVTEVHSAMAEERRQKKSGQVQATPITPVIDNRPDSLAMYVARREATRLAQQSDTGPLLPVATSPPQPAPLRYAPGSILSSRPGLSEEFNVPESILDTMIALGDTGLRSRSPSITISLAVSPAPSSRMSYSPTPDGLGQKRRRRAQSTACAFDEAITSLGSKRVRTPSRKARESSQADGSKDGR